MSDVTQRFIQQLFKWKKAEERGKLATLRSGLGKSPGESVRLYPLIAQFLGSSDLESAHVKATFLTAALFALHPENRETKPDEKLRWTLGDSLRQAVSVKHGESGVSSRLTSALDADPEDLAYHLQGLVTVCKSSNSPINWLNFYWDVTSLLGDDEDKRDRTRLSWAKSFWGKKQDDETEIETKQNQDDKS